MYSVLVRVRGIWWRDGVGRRLITVSPSVGNDVFIIWGLPGESAGAGFAWVRFFLNDRRLAIAELWGGEVGFVTGPPLSVGGFWAGPGACLASKGNGVSEGNESASLVFGAAFSANEVRSFVPVGGGGQWNESHLGCVGVGVTPVERCYTSPPT